MPEYNLSEREILLNTARETIAKQFDSHAKTDIDLSQYPEKLQQQRACFVTLHLEKRLRGCIGSLLARQPLILDVIQNAYSAAFRDPRFKTVTLEEYPKLELDISILSQAQPLHFISELDLISKLRPGIDGLILSDKGHRATFLPSVWQELPNPTVFLRHLKNKAGFTTDYWSDTLTIENYTTELIS